MIREFHSTKRDGENVFTRHDGEKAATNPPAQEDALDCDDTCYGWDPALTGDEEEDQ